MNINTIKAIRFVVMNSPLNDKVEMITDSSEAKGNWFHKIIFKVALLNEYVLPHVEFTGKAIGNMYGEGIWVTYFDNKLKLVLS